YSIQATAFDDENTTLSTATHNVTINPDYPGIITTASDSMQGEPPAYYLHPTFVGLNGVIGQPLTTLDSTNAQSDPVALAVVTDWDPKASPDPVQPNVT